MPSAPARVSLAESKDACNEASISLISSALGTPQSSLGDCGLLSSFCGVPHSELWRSPCLQLSKETSKPSDFPCHI